MNRQPNQFANHRVVTGVALLCVAGIIFWVMVPPQLTDLKGLGCGSKTTMLGDPEVKRILADKYGIGKIDCLGDGSIKICTDKAGLEAADFVWPASLYAVALCERTLGHTLVNDVSFHSPIVFYSWDCVTDELVKRGQVVQTGGVYAIPDMQSFTQLIMAGPSWQGMCGLTSRLRVIPTDPTRSNSGSEFTALLGAMLLKGEIPNESTIEQVLPDLKKYITTLGVLDPSSSKLFAGCVSTGMGACPIFAVYESQGIDFYEQNPDYQKTIVDHFRVLYPQPTVWAAHELIVITPNGKKLLDAMKDKQIQALAWKNHGLRTGSLGNQNDPNVLGFDGIPPEIRAVINLPVPAVMDRIVEYLSKKQ